MAQISMQVVLTCLLVQCTVHAFPTGAPLNSCGNLYPSSHGPSTATGTPPFIITFSSKTYQPQQAIQVTLAGVGGAQFKGFLIEGRFENSTATDPVGFFRNPPSNAKPQCDSATGNGVTHTNNTVKPSVTFEWEAPSLASGPVVFHYTVVRGGAPSTTSDPADYFMDIKSQALPPQSDPEAKPILFHPEKSKEQALISKRMEFEVEEIPEEEYLSHHVLQLLGNTAISYLCISKTYSVQPLGLSWVNEEYEDAL